MSLLDMADELQELHYSITAPLAALEPRNAKEAISAVRETLMAIDSNADRLLEKDQERRRSQVVEMDKPGFALPPGAAQCPHAVCQRYGAIDFLSAGSAFTSFVAHCGLTAGRYMYEVAICTAGSIQIGLCGPMNMFLWGDTKGVGDFPFTVGYDGGTCRLLNVDVKTAGWKWSPGDLVTVTIDMEEGKVTYYQNGKFVGDCSLPTLPQMLREGVDCSGRDIQMCYFPCVSLDKWQQCHVNLGGCEFLYPIDGFEPVDPAGYHRVRTWLPRMAALATIPANLTPYKHIINALLLERVIQNPADEYMLFTSSIHQYMALLCRTNPTRLSDLIDALRRGLPEDMFGGLAAQLISVTCMLSSFSWKGRLQFGPKRKLTPRNQLPQFGSACCGVSISTILRYNFIQLDCLKMLHFVIDNIPEAIPSWVRTPIWSSDLMRLTYVKEPNEKDLEDLFPVLDTCDTSLFTDEGIKRLYAEQEQVAEGLMKAPEEEKRQVLGKLLFHPSVRGPLAHLLLGLINETKEAARNPNKRLSYQAFTERVVIDLVLHCISAIAREFDEEKDIATVAHMVASPSVLKHRVSDNNLSGVPHEELMAQCGDADFAGVPDVVPGCYEQLTILVCELYTMIVKDWVLSEMGGIAHFQTSRRKLLKAKAAGLLSPEEEAAMLKTLVKDTRKVSWIMSSLFLVDVHKEFLAFASLLFRTVEYYSDGPFAKYLPSTFVEAGSDFLHLCRRTCPKYSLLIDMRPEMLLFFLHHFKSDVILHQPTREYILMTVGGLIDMHETHRRQALRVIETHQGAFRQFCGQVLDQFANTMSWTLVVNFLYRHNSGNGFCLRETDEDEEGSFTSVFQLPDPIPAEEFWVYKSLRVQMLGYFDDVATWAKMTPDSSPLSFFRNTITHSNWCVTELSSILAAIDPSTNGHAVNKRVVAQLQRAVSVLGYTVKMLHIVEGMVWLTYDYFFNTTNDAAGTVPAHNAPTITAASKALLVVELVGQCLARFVLSTSVYRSIVAASLQGCEKMTHEALAAPTVGIMITMMGPIDEAIVGATSDMSPADAMAAWRRYQAGDTTALPLTVAAYVTGLVGTNAFFKQIAQPRVDWDHASVTYALTGIDWVTVCKRSHSNSNLLKLLPITAMAYEALAAHKQTVTAASGSMADLHGDDDSLCAICCVTPLEVVFQPCGHRSCRACIERHQINDGRCFFCKMDVSSTAAIVSGSVTPTSVK